MDFEALKRYRNESNPFAKLVGIVIEYLSLGYAKASLTVTEEKLSLYGSVHGGCCFTLADLVSGAACSTYGVIGVTATATYNFLRSAALHDTLTGVAVCRKQGAHLCSYDVTITNQDDKLMGTACFTYYILNKNVIQLDTLQ